MTASQFEEAARVFEAAVATADPEAFAEQACKDDPSLWDEVRSLLSAHRRADTFLESPPTGFRDQVLAPGTTLGAYRIVRLLARGGDGRVYEAAQDNPRRSVAVKVLRAAVGQDDQGRFTREAQLLANLRHPHIAHVYEAGVLENQPYLVMELVEGGRPLVEFAQSSNLPRDERLVLFLRFCSAVQRAHQQGVAHCDLKPDNMLVDRQGHAKLIDFGIARRHDTGGPHAGTPAYMSPEQCEDGHADARSDVFALGRVLHELVVDEAPGADLEAVVSKATSRDPDARYASVAGLVEDITRHLERRPVEARQGGPLYALRCFARRHRLAAALLSLLVLVLAGAAVGGTWLAVTREQARKNARRAQHDAEHQGYVASIGAAEAALRIHDVGAARRHLERAAPALRGWEWRHLMSRLDDSRRTLDAGHSIEHGAVSADGQLAAGARYGVRIWSLASGRPLAKALEGHGLSCAAFDPGSKRLLVAGVKGRAWLLDARSGEVLDTFDAHERNVWRVLWHPSDGTFFTAGLDGRVHRWDTGALGAPLSTYATTGTHPFALAVRGDVLWTGAQDGSVWRFDLEGRVPPRRSQLHEQSVEGIDISHDGALLLTGSMDRTVALWDAASMKRRWMRRVHRSGVKDVTFTSDEAACAACSVDRTASVLDVNDGELIVRLVGHTDFARTICCLSGTDDLVTFSRDGTIRQWSVRTGRRLTELTGHTTSVDVLGWKDATHLVSLTRNGSLRTWSTDKGAGHHRMLPGRAYGSPLVHVLSAANDRVALRSAQRTIAVTSLSDARILTRIPNVSAYAIAHDGEHLLCMRERLERIRLSTGELESACAAPPGVRVLAPNRSGDGVAILADRGVGLWARGRSGLGPLLDLAGCNLAAWRGDGGQFAVARDATIWIVDVDSGVPSLGATLEGHTGTVRDLAWSPDGSRLASAAQDGTVRLWDPSAALEVVVLHGHIEYATAVAWSPDGKTLASGGGNSSPEACRILLWRTDGE